ncbi:Wall-associated receptor kinase 5 [Carex littledalei]|uniref:Wall-associated receptor kinase 5 n=1 Tax=Carex littledalei TaxID=544730 RepID=A0A833QI27_9POAL|nr:Wall-associated receptor kinase 5 [Carex littledalei]
MASLIMKGHFFLYLPLISCLIILPSTAVASALPCPDKCGDITIPYPFGTRPECHRDGFNIMCNESTTPPKAFLGSDPATSIELKDINVTSGEARVYMRFGYRCYNKIDHINESFNSSYMNLTDLHIYLFSNRRNKFTAIGCLNLAFMEGIKGNYTYLSGCTSFCESLNSTTGNNGSCNGLGCCQTSIPAGLTYYGLLSVDYNNSNWKFNPCMYGMLVEEEWYKFRREDLSSNNFLTKNQKGVPLVLDWAIRDSGTCHNGVEQSRNPACLSNHSSCYNTSNGEGYLCQCKHGFEGNPYIPGGCLDIDECKFPDIYPCHGNCTNTEGSYECSCRKGTRGNATIKNCTDNFPLPARVVIISCILGIAVLLGVCFVLVWYQQHKRHMKEKEEYNRYYQMMDNHLRVFSKKQIENATDNYNDDHVIGRGGQGNVYQGLLENNQVVAIKKAKEVEETQRAEFVNEIILLSQINHKNIVRLLGCCLEVKIPMLVYEFVPNGTLFEFLHRNSSRRSISLGTRLKIALDSAVALDHLHSSITRSIIHGDVKSANILLDADYTAKVSDFGASSVVPVNEIVEIVHFSHGYVDPECLYTEIITKKSDVYSFGVVMLELLTRKEAVYIDEKGEKQSLAISFLSKAKKNEHREMLDVEIVTNEENVMEVLQEICEIALQCLSPKGEDRPTMSQVVEELQKLVRFHNSSPGQQVDQEDQIESLLEKFPSISDVSGPNSTQYSAVLEISAGAPR